MTMLELRAVTKAYGKVTALDGIELSVAKGSRTAIVGPSGCGKTTMMRIIAGFEAPDAGKVMLDGETLADHAGIVPAYRRKIGIVAQDGALFPHLTVGENIGFGLPRADRDRDARIARLADLVGLSSSMLARRPDELSGGQQQRVALARALALEPRLMLLDEPFSALDTGLRASTREAVAALLGDAGITTILVTHDQEEALSFADQVAVMDKGRFLQVGPPREIYARPATPAVASFLGDAIFLPATIAAGSALCALGRIQVADMVFAGSATLMLRPAQVSLARVSDAEIDNRDDGVRGVVMSASYAGGHSSYALSVSGGGSVAADDSAAIMLRLAAADPPVAGDRVRVRLIGSAHFFPN
ncbi:ABC transporter ATP-binding protein [Starkeya sp. ORNL1]|uniref:ABC transporter ATP-binding protein n=1 Tax=Starkeya sp. ORNL1 TaxID=2709380 RepID=UPI001462CDA5|nr:ABC transporter ATP-binding protein [Starkeya sp. ORNL1]QJP17143.1 ABC transporter ATP-binding protein [Starkeya sp. ORNL1]